MEKLTLTYLQMNEKCLWMYAGEYKAAERHNESGEDINIHYRSEQLRHHQVVVTVEPKQQQLNCLSSERESCRAAGGSEKQETQAEERFRSREPCGKIKA